MDRLSLIAKLQGIYWAVTGAWPLIHMPSFLMVTGPKTDLWLVVTVSLVLLLIGLVLTAAGFRRSVTAEIKWLGIGGAAAMAFVDFYYALHNVIWDTYMLDGVAEIILITLWFWAGKRGLAEAVHKH